MEQRKENDRNEQTNIRLVVSDEQTLYTPFNPDAEFSWPVKSYIQSKAAIGNPRHSINLTVISREPLDEDRFRAAVANWVGEEKALFRKKEKETKRSLAGLLVIGSALFMLSLALQTQFEVLKYSLLPILGSLALSKAAGILLLDMPTVRAQRWLIDEMERKCEITFEYGHQDKE